MSERRYEASDIVTLSQGEAYRSKIGMYLSADLQEAINLALRELIVNSQDEYAVYRPKNAYVRITIDTKTKIISVEDNGRGIPVGVREDGVNSLTAAMMLAHSGGKHTEGAYTSAIGVHGLGSKLVNHTARWLEVEVKRDGKIYSQRFESDDQGAHPVTEVLSKAYRKKDTGTKITYLPDDRVYGAVFIDLNSLRAMLTEISYFTIGLNLILEVDGKVEAFLSKNGLLDGLNPEHRIGEPIHFFYSEAECEVELALQWVKKGGSIRGYANGLYMPDGGAFITGFRSSLTRVFNRLAGKSFTGEQIRSVLDGFVSVKVKVGQFSNQSKTALANAEARTATSAAIVKALENYSAVCKKTFEQVSELLTKVEKADLAADRARTAVFAHNQATVAVARKKTILLEKLKDCREHGEDSVLIISEGDSTITPLNSARDLNKHALFPIRGKLKNALRAPIDEVLENKEISDIMLALGAGIQEKYNSRKLRYGSVWIATDGDVDGANIAMLITVMFYVLMPKFIEEGRLKWLRAPLFKAERRGKKFFAYTIEEIEPYRGGGWTITRLKGLGEFKPEDIADSMFSGNQRLEVFTYDEKTKKYANHMLENLMGDDPAFRREFIFDRIDFEKIEV